MVLLDHTIKIILLRVGSEKREGKGQESRKGKAVMGSGQERRWKARGGEK